MHKPTGGSSGWVSRMPGIEQIVVVFDSSQPGSLPQALWNAYAIADSAAEAECVVEEAQREGLQLVVQTFEELMGGVEKAVAQGTPHSRLDPRETVTELRENPFFSAPPALSLKRRIRRKIQPFFVVVKPYIPLRLLQLAATLWKKI